MPEDSFYDLVIIGGGPCGLTAGLYAMRAVLKTVLIEKAIPGGQVAIPKDVENYPGVDVMPGMDLTEKMFQQVRRYGLEFMRDEVVAVEPGLDGHTVRLAGGSAIQAHAVLLATGGTHRKLQVPGEVEFFGSGVSYCATCDGFFFKGKTVVVVGGGDTAVEEALYLTKLAQKVYLVHRRDALRASRILQQRLMADPRAEIIWNTVVTDILADSSGVNAVQLRSTVTGETRRLDADGIFIFIGFLPDNHLVPAGVRMDADGYVITDEKCETNLPGIFVAGDLRQKYARQIVIAAGEGATAALAIAHYVENRKAATP